MILSQFEIRATLEARRSENPTAVLEALESMNNQQRFRILSHIEQINGILLHVENWTPMQASTIFGELKQQSPLWITGHTSIMDAQRSISHWGLPPPASMLPPPPASMRRAPPPPPPPINEIVLRPRMQAMDISPRDRSSDSNSNDVFGDHALERPWKYGRKIQSGPIVKSARHVYSPQYVAREPMRMRGSGRGRDSDKNVDDWGSSSSDDAVAANSRRREYSFSLPPPSIRRRRSKSPRVRGPKRQASHYSDVTVDRRASFITEDGTKASISAEKTDNVPIMVAAHNLPDDLVSPFEASEELVDRLISQWIDIHDQDEEDKIENKDKSQGNPSAPSKKDNGDL